MRRSTQTLPAHGTQTEVRRSRKRRVTGEAPGREKKMDDVVEETICDAATHCPVSLL